MEFLTRFSLKSKNSLIQRLYRTFAWETSISKQKGQGLIEYLLMLVLTAAFVMALSKGVGRPIQKYIQSNVLDIVGCMLRVGQFPTKSFGLCQNAAKIKAEFASSVPDMSSEGSGGSSGANQNKSQSQNKKSAKKKNNKKRNGSNSKKRIKSPGSRGNSIDGGGGSGSDKPPTKSVKINRGDLDGGGGSLKTGAFKDRGTTIIVRKIKGDGRIGGSFYISKDSKAKTEDKPKFKVTSTKVNPVVTDELRSANSSFMVPKGKDNRLASMSVDTEMEADLSFFGTIKWVIIIAILVIFGVFAASQINSIRKGWTD